MPETAKEKILVVGGGTAGLIAAKELLQHNYAVTVLEADNRLGGRIHTLHNEGFSQPVEKGVEFIHGNLKLTIGLLKEAEAEYVPVKGKWVRLVNGEWTKQGGFTIGWGKLMRRMKKVENDMTLADFLETYFSKDKYTALRKSAIQFAGGFDLADPGKASVIALREEWRNEGRQYRLKGGYSQMVDYLEKQCRNMGAEIYTGHTVTQIHWKKDEVTIAAGNKNYTAAKAIIALPLGVLQADTIAFAPAIDEYMKAFKKMGYGKVVKVVLEFSSSFWEEKKKNLGFVMSAEAIPTWWTQRPSDYPLLTGWAGWPQAKKLENKTDAEILEIALTTLSGIFNKPVEELKQLLKTALVTNWGQYSNTRGAYSYSTLESKMARQLLNTPVENTLYFAGEALYEGPAPGTVEAALESGKKIAGVILKN